MTQNVALLVLTFLVHFSASSLSIHGLFSDNMVLQTSHRSGHGPGVLKGKSSPGDTVTLSSVGEKFPGAPYSTKADSEGMFEFELVNNSATDSDGPYSLQLSSGTRVTDTISADNVFFGEVFLCSGQSNMEYNVGGIHNASAELKLADTGAFDNVRLFQVGKLPNWNDGKAVAPQAIGQVTGRVDP
jgi:sialate O-acetylesterase